MKQTTYFLRYLLENKIEAIHNSLRDQIPAKIVTGMTLFSISNFAIYGFILGMTHSLPQGLASAMKLPFLFFACSFICYPTLYLFLALMGMRTGLRAIAQFTLVCLTLTSSVLLAFSPISLFFLVSSTPYGVIKLINVGIMAIAGFCGLYLFNKYLSQEVPKTGGVSEKRVNVFIRFWLILYGFMGANLGFAISPVFGMKGAPFIWFTPSNENFFTHFFHLL